MVSFLLYSTLLYIGHIYDWWITNMTCLICSPCSAEVQKWRSYCDVGGFFTKFTHAGSVFNQQKNLLSPPPRTIRPRRLPSNKFLFPPTKIQSPY